MVDKCGPGTPDLWRIRCDDEEAPALKNVQPLIGELRGKLAGWSD